MPYDPVINGTRFRSDRFKVYGRYFDAHEAAYQRPHQAPITPQPGAIKAGQRVSIWDTEPTPWYDHVIERFEVNSVEFVERV